jgi:2-isopropylmalate synthase
VFRKDLGHALDLVSEVIGYARSQRPDLLIRYTPEDTVRSAYDNVVRAAAAAVRAGADIISVADTTGHMIPGTSRSMHDFVLRLKTGLAELGLHPRIAVHCHNDRGLALANAMDGVRAGAEIVDASTLGLGERAGITDLAQVLTLLQHDWSEDNGWRLSELPELYDFVSCHAGVGIHPHAPLVGRNAFTHCAGVHTHAATKNPVHYQSVDPIWVGRTMEVALDHMSGTSSVRYGLRRLGLDEPPTQLVLGVLDQIRIVGETGRIVDLQELEEIVNWWEHNDQN